MIWSWGKKSVTPSPAARPAAGEHDTRLALDEVTLCAVDSVTPEMAAQALRVSQAGCRFGDAVLFTDRPVRDPAFRTEAIDRLASRDAYSGFIFKQLAARIQTPYALIVQWDGFVLDAAAWQPDFLDYDLIGARWHWHRDGMTVGNGGFTLRSKKLLDLLASDAYPLLPGVPEDELICRRYRPSLEEEFGIRFAPEALADRFSYERTMPQAPTFGFHGLFNMWRHVDDSTMLAMVADFPAHLLRSREYHELLDAYVQLRKFPLVRAMYGRLREENDAARILAGLTEFLGDAAHAAACLAVCRRTAGEEDADDR